METSSPTPGGEKAVTPATNVQDEDNAVKCADTLSTCDSNVDSTQPNDLPDRGNVPAEKSIEKSDVSMEETVHQPADTSEVNVPAVNSDNDSLKTEEKPMSSAEPLVSPDNSAPVQVKSPSETDVVQENTPEIMETENTIQLATEVVDSVSKEVDMEDPQSTAGEPIPQVSQQPTTVPVEAESNAETEIIDVSEPSPETQNESATTVASGNPGSLSLLAEMYDSGNDSDVCEVPSMQNYQNRVVEIDSDTESSSSSDSDVEDNEPIDVDALNAAIADDDEEEAVRSSRSPRVKGEFHLDDLPPIHELQITVPEEECTELGKVQSIVEQLVIVNSLPGTVPLDLDTVLFLDKGKKVLGEVFDVLGQVSDPLYCVRFNSNKDIKNKGIEVGQIVYVAPRTQHTQFVILANLMKERGSDASWEYDIEPPQRYLDYSDDEEERSARRSIRNKNRPVEAGVEGPKRHRPADASPHSGPRPYRGNHHGAPRMQHFPDSYRIAGSSWHSNYPSNYNNPQQQFNQYRPPPRFYRPPAHGMPVRPPAHSMPPTHDMPVRPPAHPGMVVNPYAVFPPPHLMQQPLFPPPTHQPPPPAPQGPHGGY